MLVAWWLFAAAVVAGHFGLHLTVYNRINATGLPRAWIKRMEFVLLATCLLIPVVVVWGYPDALAAISVGSLSPADLPLPLSVYALICVVTVGIFGLPWFLSRPALNSDAIEVQREVEHVHVDRVVTSPLAHTSKCRWVSCIPGNQIFELSIERKSLPVAGLPRPLHGFRIAHLSDVHLTGHIGPDFIRYAVDAASRWHPDLIALTGDIIDKAACIEWLGDCFGGAVARYGCHFVLGNHDLRVPDPNDVRKTMIAWGWNDLGGRTMTLKVKGLRLQLIGNEAPWFPAAPLAENVCPENEFRLVLSHSPDQLEWARRRDVRLLLAGHTHGGQGRLPLVGPVLAPSRYGSRYASGSFYVAPTTMHVSRGLSGAHLLRINCRPELALLTLTTAAREPAYEAIPAAVRVKVPSLSTSG